MPETANTSSTGAKRREVRSLVIVAREQRELWAALAHEFKSIEEIQVVLDRRKGERRKMVQPVSQDRRAGERRTVPRLEDDLRARQYVLVRPRRARSSD
jgi:hypothetical protein